MKKFFIAIGLSVLGLCVIWAPVSGGGLVPDVVMVQFPKGYTQLMLIDLNKFLKDPALKAGVIDPLVAANQPLVSGAVRTLGLLRLDAKNVQYVAHGKGPGLTDLTLFNGVDPRAAAVALRGLEWAVGVPGSPYRSWKLESIEGFDIFFIGAIFGPIRIQWAYLPLSPDALWVATEVVFAPAEPEVAKVRRTVEQLVGRLLGRVGYFDELLIGAWVRGGDVAYVRAPSDPQRAKPFEAGEQAMGFSLSVVGDKVAGKFTLRFDTAEQAAAALENIKASKSSYLKQELYEAKFVRAQQSGRSLEVETETTLRGIVGLIQLVMPI